MAIASGTQAYRRSGIHRSLSRHQLNSTSSLHLFLFLSLPFLLLLFIHVHSFLFFFFSCYFSCLVVRPANSTAPLHSYRLPPPSRHAAAFDLNSDCVLSLFPGGSSPLSRLSFDDSTVHNIPSLHSFGSGSPSSELSSLSVDVRRYAAQTRDAPHYLTPYRLCAAPPVRHFDSHSQGNPFGFF